MQGFQGFQPPARPLEPRVDAPEEVLVGPVLLMHDDMTVAQWHGNTCEQMLELIHACAWV